MPSDYTQPVRITRCASAVVAAAVAVAVILSGARAQDAPAPQEPTIDAQPQAATDLPTTSEDPASEAEVEAAARTDAMVNQMLDAAVRLDLSNRPLPAVLEAITESTGVPFYVSDATYALLPYGRQTPISVKVAATPLRQTLAAITQRLGLRFVLRDEQVELRPLPALERAGRRATVEEIAMLDLLAGVRLDLVEDRPTAAQLLEEVDLKLQALDTASEEAGRPRPGFVVENRLNDELRERPVFVARNGTLLEAMEAIHEQSAATWYPWGDTLVVVPKDAWVRRMLERPINLSYNRVDVQQVLGDLQQAARVPFRIEAGALQRVPEEFRRVRLFLENASVREALELLGGVTGLSYGVDDDGIYLWNSDPSSEARPTGMGRSSQRDVEQPMLLVDLGDGTSLLVYESDLPADIREELAGRREAAIENLRSQLPATRPTED